MYVFVHIYMYMYFFTLLTFDMKNSKFYKGSVHVQSKPLKLRKKIFKHLFGLKPFDSFLAKLCN